MDRAQRDISILEHIVKWCDEIAETHKTFGDDVQVFTNNKDYLKSISMSLLQIGELTNHLSKGFQKNFPQIQYSGIISQRNLIVHGYGMLETKMLWDTSHNDITELKRQCNEIINEIKSHI